MIDPASQLDERLDLLIEGTRIARLGRRLRAPEARRIELDGKLLCPGLIDMHVHLREPGGEDSETIRSGCQAAVAGGFTAVAAMPNTNPVNDDPAVTEAILREAAQVGLARVWPIAAISRGSRGEELCEFGLLKEAGAVAVSDDGRPVASAELMRHALEYAGQHGMPLIEHAEDPSLGARGVMHEGVVSTRLGLRGQPACNETIAVARDIELARLTGARLHVAHVSTAGAVELIRRAKADGLAVTAEVTPHHLRLSDEAVGEYDTHAKMKPPLREDRDIEALCAGVADGTIDAIATDHAPHNPDLKAMEFDHAPFGVIGLETAVPVVLDTLYHERGLPLPRIVEALSLAPARILGLDAGRIAEGAVADLSVLDPEREHRVDVRQFRSLSRNCPFDGWTLRGAASMTIVGGRVVFDVEQRRR